MKGENGNKEMNATLGRQSFQPWKRTIERIFQQKEKFQNSHRKLVLVH